LYEFIITKPAMSEKRISHEGVIASMSQDRVTISIGSDAACATCHARGACNLSVGQEEKLLHIPVQDANFSVGEKVMVNLDRSLGFRALLLGYVIPFLLVLLVLLSMTIAGSHEWVAGLASLAVLIPYYIGLKLMKRRVDRQFFFSIHKT
jgi:sigma-E factor negative regulatory protein RseC